jgi:hypothetical protein
MTLPRVLLIGGSAVLLLAISLGVTLPYWLPSAIRLTPLESSIQIGSADWEKPTQLRVDRLVYEQGGVKIQADGIKLSWVELMDFSLSATAIDVAYLQLVYQQAPSEQSTEAEQAFQLPLPEQLPALNIAKAEVIYDQVKLPIQISVTHNNDTSYPLNAVVEYLSKTLGTLGLSWEGEELDGSLVIQGHLLTKLIHEQKIVDSKKLGLESALLSGELMSGFEFDTMTQSLKAHVVVPSGDIKHEQLNLAWITPWEIDLIGNSQQWQARLTETIHGSFSEFGDIYKQVEWPTLVQQEQLPKVFSFVLKEGSQFDSEQHFSGDIKINTSDIQLTLEQVKASAEQQKGRWALQAKTPSWLNIAADIDVSGEGDFLHDEDWVVNLAPKVAVRDWQNDSFQCQSMTLDTNTPIQLTLGSDEIKALKGELNTAFKHCKQGDFAIDEWFTQLHLVNPEQAKFVFEWPNHLHGEADLMKSGDDLTVQMEAQSEETNALVQDLSLGLVANGLTQIAGQASANRQRLGDVSGQWRASFSGDGQYDDIKAAGIDVLLTGGLNGNVIEVDPTSSIQLGQVDAGLSIHDLKGTLSGQISGENVDLRLADIQGQLLDGSLSIDSIALQPEATGISLLRLDNITLDELAQLQSQEGIALQGEVSGRFPLEFDSSGVHVKEGKLYNITPGFIRIKDNPEVQNLKQSSEQAAQALNLLENLDFEVLNSTVNFTPAGDLTLAVSIEGRNPDIDQAINFNYTHEENLYQLLQSLRLGDKLTEKVQQQYQERTQ